MRLRWRNRSSLGWRSRRRGLSVWNHLSAGVHILVLCKARRVDGRHRRRWRRRLLRGLWLGSGCGASVVQVGVALLLSGSLEYGVSLEAFTASSTFSERTLLLALLVSFFFGAGLVACCGVGGAALLT